MAEAVVEYLAPVQERYAELRPDEAELERILAAGADKAREIAAGTLADVRQAMGVGDSLVLFAHLAVVDRGHDGDAAHDVAGEDRDEPLDRLTHAQRAVEQSSRTR